MLCSTCLIAFRLLTDTAGKRLAGGDRAGWFAALLRSGRFKW